jgi:NAD(P)-dependent dehydrogenase (short-subunit alcohol dehydrogenase family)
MELDLKGRSAVVTGGSSGIGASIARSLAEEGVNVVICSRGTDALEELARDLTDAPGEVIAVRADTGSLEDVRQLMATVGERLGGLDILVNNAGSSLFAPLEEVPDERWIADLNVKLVGYARCIREGLPLLRKSGAACVVNVGGNAGRQPLVYHLPGGAANAGLLNLTQSMAQYLGPDGIRVVGVAPGLVDTPRLFTQLEVQARVWGVSEEIARERMVEQIALRKIATSEDVADLVAFLVSDRAALITGTTITIDGGTTKGI